MRIWSTGLPKMYLGMIQTPGARPGRCARRRRRSRRRCPSPSCPCPGPPLACPRRSSCRCRSGRASAPGRTCPTPGTPVRASGYSSGGRWRPAGRRSMRVSPRVELDRPRRRPHRAATCSTPVSKRDQLAQAEVVDVFVEVRCDLRVVGEVRVGGRHREVRVLHARARGVDEQVAVGGGHAVGVFEHPVAADTVGLLKAVERDPALVQRLHRGDPRGAGADHARARQRSRRAVAHQVTESVGSPPLCLRLVHCSARLAVRGTGRRADVLWRSLRAASASAWPARPPSSGAKEPRHRATPRRSAR